jgi:prephenate dehydrogenase
VSPVPFDHLVILAPGLLGASVARGARARGLARRVTLWARRPETRAELRGQPWVDAVAETPALAVSSADLVVLAAPVERIIELHREIAHHLRPQALVTDVGSVKGPICAAAQSLARPGGPLFVGAHPMSGGAQTGWTNASATLFEHRVCFLTPEADAPRDPVERLTAFWNGLGATVVEVAPAKHDEIVAHISHLPQALATSLACTLAAHDGQWRHFAGNGLRDTSRIAASDATMWLEIFSQNREPVLRALAAYETEIAALRAAIERHDWPDVRTRLERGRQWRDGFKA